MITISTHYCGSAEGVAGVVQLVHIHLIPHRGYPLERLVGSHTFEISLDITGDDTLKGMVRLVDFSKAHLKLYRPELGE